LASSPRWDIITLPITKKRGKKARRCFSLLFSGEREEKEGEERKERKETKAAVLNLLSGGKGRKKKEEKKKGREKPGVDGLAVYLLSFSSFKKERGGEMKGGERVFFLSSSEKK